MNAAVQDLKLSNGRLFVGGTFQTVGGATKRGLVALNAATGAVDPILNNITLSEARVTQSGATSPVQVIEMDITPDGSRLVIIGNFNRVNGALRGQVAIIDLTTNPASLHSWATDRFLANCAAVFPAWVRGVSISPDGSYFAIATTGAPFGPTRLCDTVSRWELGRSGPGQLETWANHTGGDTLYSVAITGAAVYVGGHQRWMNNPHGRDSAGPGAVPREGIAAVDPVTGLALPWNPGKTRGVGVQDIFATERGLWIGSDTNYVAGELHRKVAFFPL